MTGDEAKAVFAGNVERERARQQLTWAVLAERAGAPEPSLHKSVSPDYPGPSLPTMARVAAGLGVPLASLLAEPECSSCYDSPPAGFTCNACGKQSSPGCPSCSGTGMVHAGKSEPEPCQTCAGQS